MRTRLTSSVLPLVLSVIALAAGASAPAADLSVVSSIKGADGAWDYAAVDSDLHRLYVGRADGVMSVNLDDGAVTPTLVPGKKVHGIAVLPGGLAVSTNGDSGSATIFKTADGSVLADIPTGKKPDAVAYDPKSGLVAVVNGKGGTVSLVDVAAKNQAATIEVGGKLEFAVADGEGRMFVNVEDRNETVELDIPGHTLIARHTLPNCDSPTGLAIDRAHHVLVAACANGHAIALSAVDGKVLATLPIGKGPDAVIFDEAGQRFLVPCGSDGVLTVIGDADGQPKVTGTIKTAKGARTGAIDGKTGKVYLPTAEFRPSTDAERAQAIPGSFQILVLAQE